MPASPSLSLAYGLPSRCFPWSLAPTQEAVAIHVTFALEVKASCYQRICRMHFYFEPRKLPRTFFEKSKGHLNESEREGLQMPLGTTFSKKPQSLASQRVTTHICYGLRWGRQLSVIRCMLSPESSGTLRVVKGGEVPLTARGWTLVKNSYLLKAPGVNWKGPRKEPLVFAGSMWFFSSSLPSQADLPHGAKGAAAAPASLRPG